MAELVYQTWERITGRPWSDARKGGFTTGTYVENIALQKRLLGGWNPYAPKPKPAAPAPRPAPAPAPAPAPRAPSPGPVPVAPGISAQQWEAMISLQRETARTLAGVDRERIAAEKFMEAARLGEIRRTTEIGYAANPADFVAYELYKRSLVGQGFEPLSDFRTDPEIQDLFSMALDLDTGGTIGTGRFGVDIPATQSISRSELQAFNPTDIDILSSFLRGGVETDGGKFQGVNPEDYFAELEEGLVPVLPTQRTQYAF